NARSNRARRSLGIPENPPEEALARGADENGKTERHDLVQPRQELEVVLDRLAEPDSRIEADALLRNPGLDREGEPLLEERRDFGDDIVVTGIVLHAARLSEHVHQAKVGASV